MQVIIGQGRDGRMMNRMPDAYANLQGGPQNPNLRGRTVFYRQPQGTLVIADVSGLPAQNGQESVLGFHIHEGTACTGTKEDPFQATGGHLNPSGQPHPFHMGDLPPLFAHDGEAWMAVHCGRFQVEDILGHTLVVHGMPDDFTSQPAGHAGAKIACGTILPWA